MKLSITFNEIDPKKKKEFFRLKTSCSYCHFCGCNITLGMIKICKSIINQYVGRQASIICPVCAIKIGNMGKEILKENNFF